MCNASWPFFSSADITYNLDCPEYKDCRKSLKPSDYEGYRNNLFFKRHENSCAWLLADERYIAWDTDDNRSILWLSGDPGCGKSVMASYLCKELQSHKVDALSIAYFFCDNKNEQLRTPTSILANILTQLLEQLPAIYKHLWAELKCKSESGRVWTYEMLWRAFDKIMNDPNIGSIRILIDALGIQPLSEKSL
jgi:Cdc6-like AAA superfamily ATPase